MKWQGKMIHLFSMIKMNQEIILGTAYLAPIQYFTKIILSNNVLIEQHENFIKQTYRNRCIILGANGTIPLVIPVEKGRGGKTKVKDIRVYNGLPWQRNHWRSIFSAYNSSPYFEYYEESLNRFYSKKWDFLFDFNTEITNWVLEELEIEASLTMTSEFIEGGITSFREYISPKNTIKDPGFIPFPYTQVFSDKFEFLPNLSIIDLLFNEGPNSYNVLENSIA